MFIAFSVWGIGFVSYVIYSHKKSKKTNYFDVTKKIKKYKRLKDNLNAKNIFK